MQKLFYSNILYSLTKREPFIDLGSQQGWVGVVVSVGPHRGGYRFEHPRLAEVVPNCLVAF